MTAVVHLEMKWEVVAAMYMQELRSTTIVGVQSYYSSHASHLGDDSVTDGTSHIVKINIYPTGAARPQPCRDVFCVVVDNC